MSTINKKKEKVKEIVKRLKNEYPDSKCSLIYESPFQLLVATILSAQCTDERVNSVTPALFKKYPGPEQMAKAKLSNLEIIIHSTGFYRSKANSLIRCSQELVKEFNGRVPATIEELTSLHGIGRKTANVILGTCFEKPAIIVDTHVKRVANRLGLTTQSDPTKIEYDLQALFPQKDWSGGSQRLLLHGRYVCVARAPKCGPCAVYVECHWKGKLPRT